jgi:hypothetical protein
MRAHGVLRCDAQQRGRAVVGLEGSSAAGRDRREASQQLLAWRPWWRRRTRYERAEDGLDLLVQRGVLVEDGSAVEETDAADGASQDGVIMRCGGQMSIR